MTILMEQIFPVDAGAYETAGEASTTIKRKLKQLGIDAGVLRRVSVASYEVELNLAHIPIICIDYFTKHIRISVI